MTGADAGNRRRGRGSRGEASRFAQPHQQAALGNIGGLAAHGAVAGLQIDVEFAGQPLMLAPVADFAQAQEDDRASLEAFRHAADVFAAAIDRHAVGGGADGRLLDVGHAIGDCANEARIVAGVARQAVGGFDLVLDGAGNTG